MGIYKDNKKAKVHTVIECPVCHTRFEKIQWSQAFCCTGCKDKFHNMICKDRHRYDTDPGCEECYNVSENLDIYS